MMIGINRRCYNPHFLKLIWLGFVVNCINDIPSYSVTTLSAPSTISKIGWVLNGSILLVNGDGWTTTFHPLMVGPMKKVRRTQLLLKSPIFILLGGPSSIVRITVIISSASGFINSNDWITTRQTQTAFNYFGW